MSPRLRAKLDTLHPEVVAALEEVGCAVQRLAEGRGVPDLLVFSPWLRPPGLLVMECKGDRGTLTPAQERWIADWPGPVHVVRSPEEALVVAGLARSTARSLTERRTG